MAFDYQTHRDRVESFVLPLIREADKSRLQLAQTTERETIEREARAGARSASRPVQPPRIASRFPIVSVAPSRPHMARIEGAGRPPRVHRRERRAPSLAFALGGHPV